MLLDDDELMELVKVPPEDYSAPSHWWLRANQRVAKAQLKKMVERLEDSLENSFVMAYVEENAPYESTIDPITIREIIDDMRQALQGEVK